MFKATEGTLGKTVKLSSYKSSLFKDHWGTLGLRDVLQSEAEISDTLGRSVCHLSETWPPPCTSCIFWLIWESKQTFYAHSNFDMDHLTCALCSSRTLPRRLWFNSWFLLVSAFCITSSVLTQTRDEEKQWLNCPVSPYGWEWGWGSWGCLSEDFG